jgi:indolepyruvate ferredoxin oxidoreductase, beta subunit
MANDIHNILIVGVGGQGVLLASEIISEVAMRSGLDVKKSEVHGMSQRGGVVTSHVRIGKKVYSPLIQQGDTNFLMAFEQAEGLRAISWMRKDGIAIVSRSSLVPAIVTSSREFKYPDDAVADMQKKVARVIAVDADKIAGELGNPRLVNTILIGVLSNYLPFAANLWVETIKSQVKPKLVDINLTALERGRQIRLESVKA